jgi:hypothetical protein
MDPECLLKRSLYFDPEQSNLYTRNKFLLDHF